MEIKQTATKMSIENLKTYKKLFDNSIVCKRDDNNIEEAQKILFNIINDNVTIDGNLVKFVISEIIKKEEKSIVLKTIMNGGTLKEQNKNLVDEISSSFTYNSRIMFANKMLSELGINEKVTKIKDLTKHESYIQKQLQNYC